MHKVSRRLFHTQGDLRLCTSKGVEHQLGAVRAERLHGSNAKSVLHFLSSHNAEARL